eukprot:4773400-Pleurochrysis_carterae.AAC.1
MDTSMYDLQLLQKRHISSSVGNDRYVVVRLVHTILHAIFPCFAALPTPHSRRGVQAGGEMNGVGIGSWDRPGSEAAGAEAAVDQSAPD